MKKKMSERWIYEDTLPALNSKFRRLEINLHSQKNASNVNVRKFLDVIKKEEVTYKDN